MKSPNIIGLSAQLQNGKDTVAALILKLTSKESVFSDWKTRRFAGKLKEMTAILLGCRVEDLEDNNFKNKPLDEVWRRWYLEDENLKQDPATPEGRVGPYFNTKEEAAAYYAERWGWVPVPMNVVSELLTPRKILQVLGTEGGRDTIHPNIWVNATLGDLTENDFTIITDARFPNEVEGIKRKNGIVVRIVRPSMISTSTHPSETALNDYQNWDYLIINDGTIEDLEKKVKKMLEDFNII